MSESGVFLVVVEGPDRGLRFDVHDVIEVGRETEQCAVGDPEVSRRHLRVRRTSGGAEVEDLASKNGTWVNGEPITGPVLAVAGDVVRIGNTSIEVHITPADDDQRPEGTPAEIDHVPAPSGFFNPPATSVRRGVATRDLLVQLLVFGAIGATAAALIIYFAIR